MSSEMITSSTVQQPEPLTHGTTPKRAKNTAIPRLGMFLLEYLAVGPLGVVKVLAFKLSCIHN